MIRSLPVNQSRLEQYLYYPESELITDSNGRKVPENWFTLKLRTINRPLADEVNLDIEILRKCDNVLVLNTLDYIYGHSLLFLFNLHRILKSENQLGVVVIVQPMLKWLIPRDLVSEIWTVKLGFQDFNNYYGDLSHKIDREFNRFKKVFLSNGYVIPTNENIDIKKFTGLNPYNFSNTSLLPRITFIWREDPDRLWIRNIFLSKGLKKIGLKRIQIIFQYLRVIFILKLLKSKLGSGFRFSVAGPGIYGRMPSYIDDRRVASFNEETEKALCKVYSESLIVFGIHGSGMILPSALGGMTLSLMPSRRWGNFAEDILFTENDVRLAAFQKRIVPLNISILDLRDIIVDMVTGRDSFIRKFIHDDEL
jgi:hypothetical protein